MKTCSNMIFAMIAVSLLLPSGMALAQQAAQQATPQAGRDTIGGFVGFTDRRDADFSFGARWEHDLAGPWSAGALVEHTPDYFRNDDATLLLGTANYRPAFNQRLKFTGGAGVEFKDIEGDDVVFRTGVAYDVFVEGPLTLAPNIAFNFGENEESVTLGATLAFRF